MFTFKWMTPLVCRLLPRCEGKVSLVAHLRCTPKLMEQQQQQDNFEQKFCEARTTNESIDKKRARLLYQSRKRGILENDLLLASFAKKYLDTMEPSQLEEYDRLINTTSNEWDIYYWAVGTKQPPVEYRGPIMDKLIQHARNEEREQRFKQPELN